MHLIQRYSPVNLYISTRRDTSTDRCVRRFALSLGEAVEAFHIVTNAAGHLEFLRPRTLAADCSERSPIFFIGIDTPCCNGLSKVLLFLFRETQFRGLVFLAHIAAYPNDMCEQYSK